MKKIRINKQHAQGHLTVLLIFNRTTCQKSIKYLTIILAVILSGCTKLSQDAWYKYQLSITTGLAESIETNDGSVAIKFTKNSNHSHLLSLSRLKQKIVTASDEIKIYGRLSPKIYHTKSGKGYNEKGEKVSYLTSEKFQYFELKFWSIQLPIQEAVHEYDDNDQLKIAIEERHTLTKKDFVSPINTAPKIYDANNKKGQ